MSPGAIAFVILTVIAWLLVLAYLVLLGRSFLASVKGMWIQLGITWAAVLATSLIFPLRSAAGVASALLLASAPAVVMWIRRGRSGPDVPWRVWMNPRALVGISFILLVSVLLALQVPGPVSAFDSGLYHLATISQSLDFGSLLGAGNLYPPYAYHNGLFPFAGFLSAVTGTDQGFRLVNGVLLLMALTDLCSRWVKGSRTPGTYVLALGLVTVAVFTLPLGDFWFVSPTPDTAVFILYVVFSAYFVDALASSDAPESNLMLACSLVVGAIAGSTRPLYLLPLAVAVGVVLFHRRGSLAALVRAPIIVGSAILGGVVVVFGLARDVLLSGWLWYPLGLISFPVDWAAPDPEPVRDVALAFNRAGYTGAEYMWSAEGWDWIPLWFSDYLFTNRVTVLVFVLLGLMAIAGVVLCRMRKARACGGALLILALVPSVATVGVWFFATPPALRFIWGPVFMIPIIVLSWNASALTQAQQLRARMPVVTVMAGVFTVIAFGSALLAVDRMDADAMGEERILGQAASAQRLPSVGYEVVTLPSGADFLAPTGWMLQCWAESRCSREPVPGLDSRGSDFRDGFVHIEE